MRTPLTASSWWGLRLALFLLAPVAALVWFFAGTQTLFWWVLVPFFLGVAGIRIGTALQQNRAARAVDGTGREHIRIADSNRAEPLNDGHADAERIADGGKRTE
ncbi:MULTISPECIES: hypothetical protein [unclassified Haladaptatus]|uniref:hypothetical protein n=1 Tax=unclassified Haladaptatus TaxID=2622732 RepID=UPI0023E89B74|nr:MULTISPECIES: hypothetical protein [unclassified Haladaptatus]